jgi:hypothetical protein
LKQHFGDDVQAEKLRLVDIGGEGQETGEAVPVQFEPCATKKGQATAWFLVPPRGSGERRFRLAVSDRPVAGQTLAIRSGDDGRFYDVLEGSLPVIRYNQGTVPVPDGIDPAYARGDYIHPLFGPAGEVLTDDYPKDHPHHRGVSWSWPVTRWGDEVRDIWAVRGVWSRPVAMRRTEAGAVFALLEAENEWKWGDKDPIVRETVVIRAFRQSQGNRIVDVEVRLTGLVDGAAIGGRPGGGYGGFSLRAAPGQDQKIVLHTGASPSNPEQAWIDYSAVFPKGQRRTGVTIYEHPSVPGYPSQLLQYPNLNCVMPAFPGTREVPLPKGETLVLKHRLWIHSGTAEEEALAAVWSMFAAPPKVIVR